MARAPRTRALSAENFEDAPEWFLEQFLPAFNDFAGDTAECLDKGLTRDENGDSTIVEKVRVQTEASVAADSKPFPIFLSPKMRRRPKSVQVVRAENKTNGAAFTTAVFPTWDIAPSGQVRIRFLTGLSVSTAYEFSFALE